MFAVTFRKLYALAASLSEIIKFGPFALAAAYSLNINHIGTMKREYSLNTFVVDDAPNCEHLVYTAAFAGNYSAGEDLNAFFIAFVYFAVHIDRIAYLEVRKFIFQTLFFNSI